MPKNPPKTETGDKRRNVLLVDDNDELRSATRELLEDLGHSVTSVARGDKAIDLAGASPSPFDLPPSDLPPFDLPPFDILVSDVRMPGASGLEVTERLLERRADLAVVLISSHQGMPELVARVEEGDVTFLAKPFSPAELVAKLAEAEARAALRRLPADRLAQDRLAADTTRPTHRQDRPTPAGTRRRSRRVAFGAVSAWQLAAAAVLVLGLGALMRNVDSGAPALPGVAAENTASRTVRSSAVEQVAPSGSLAESPDEVTWSPVSAARSYTVRVSGVDGEVIWQTEVEQATARLSGEAASSLHRGVIYYWSVEALNADHEPLASSGPVPFSIAIGTSSGLEPQP